MQHCEWYTIRIPVKENSVRTLPSSFTVVSTMAKISLMHEYSFHNEIQNLVSPDVKKTPFGNAAKSAQNSLCTEWPPTICPVEICSCQHFVVEKD